MSKSVFVGELTWKEYEARVAQGNCVMMLPVGALEQHGHHMCMNVDVLLPTAVCQRVAERIGALVLPGLQYGYKSQQKSGGGNHFPGTTSLDGATLTGTVQDIIRELARHGARKLVLMNGHYENSMFIVEGIDLGLRELRYAGIHDFRVVVLSYWDFINDPAVIAQLYPDGFLGWDIEHGGVFETSLMLALYPQLVDMDKVVDHPPAKFPPYDVFPVIAERTPACGTLSSAKDASREKGELILQVCTEGIAAAIQEAFSPQS
ncbi:creatininase [Pseudomonas panipatensis]|jgi:creatinine amidohydrolase|uniref:Creatininase n=1 Tax=Pseudomonas panipatensis TaxID=428992 RepID=A0A1G8M182_9PSED|nr:creatininase [Pseudomonas panipatensis]SDI61507.1 creatinine amidohydrolase [Pseudomonas panipatensis]SMP48368.1 creatinine amidohydrolase [Pseudomonas panipatensis]